MIDKINKKKFNNGITLIELLIVFLILSLLSMISVMIVGSTIASSKKTAIKYSAINYIKDVEKSIAKEEKINYKSEETYNVTSGTLIDGYYYMAMNDLVNVEGSLPSGDDDYITLNESHEVWDAQLTIDGYIVIFSNGEIVKITKTK